MGLMVCFNLCLSVKKLRDICPAHLSKIMTKGSYDLTGTNFLNAFFSSFNLQVHFRDNSSTYLFWCGFFHPINLSSISVKSVCKTSILFYCL